MALDLEKIDLGGFGISEEDDTQPELNTQVRANMDEALKINPDQHAQTTKLSKQSGVPEFAVDSDPAQVEHGLKLDNIDFNQMSTRNPNTAKYLTDFNNSVIAQDDIDVLQTIEDIFDFGKTFENIGESILTGFSTQGKGFQLAGVDAAPDRIQDLIPMGAMPMGVMSIQETQMMSTQFAESMGITTDEELQKVKQESTDKLLTEIRGLQEKQQNLTPEDMNLLEEGVRAGIESLGHMAPGFALMLASGGRAAPLLTTIGAQTFTGSYGSGRADGLTPGEATWFAGIDAAIEVGTELLPTKTLETILLGKSEGLTKSALKFAIQEMGTEQLATLGQSLNSYAFGLDKEMEQAADVGEMVQIQLRRQAVTAIATVVAGGAQITAVTGVRKSIEALTQDESKKQNQGDIEQQKIDKLNEQSEKSKLRERDKESFKQFVEEADGENNTHVFIDGAQTSLYLQDKTREEIEADPALQLLADQAREASAQGNDVQIPVADFAADIAGTEHYAELRDSMTMSDETTSPFRQEQSKQETENYVKTLMDEAQENTSEYVEAQEIYSTVRDQLIDTGQVTPANASIMAQIVPAWATAQARRQGKTVQQIYTDAGLVVEGPQTGERARLEGEILLSQEDNVLTKLLAEFDEIFPEGTLDKDISESIFKIQEAKDRRDELDLPEERTKVAGFTPERVGELLEDYVHANGLETRARVAYIDPIDFVALTHPDVTVIEAESTELDVEQLQSEVDVPNLRIQTDGKIITHEGRHRMMALAKAGYKSVPVVITQPEYTSDPSDMNLKGQEFTQGKGIDLTVQNAIPVLQSNTEKFTTDEADLLFQPGEVSEDGRITRRPEEIDQEAVATEARATQQETIDRAKARTDAEALSEFNRAKAGESVTFTHRSPEDFTQFDDSLLGQNTTTPAGNLGHYLSADDVGNQERYGHELSVHEFTFENPLVIGAEVFADVMSDLTPEEVMVRRQSLMDMGHDGVLVEGLNWAIAFEGSTLSKLEEAEVFFQEGQVEPEKDLFVAHNLSAENILAAEDLGGLAAPSIAVARAGVSDFTGFGEVTLLADPKLLEDPKARTFDADIYSPRQPRAVYDIDQDVYSELYQQLDPDNLELSKPDINSMEDTTGPDNFLRSEAVEYHWLKLQGKEPKLKKAKVDPVVRKAAKIDVHPINLVEDEKFIKIATDHYQAQLDALTEKGFDVRVEKMTDWYFNEDGSLKLSKLRDLASQVDRFRRSGGIDTGKLREDIVKKIRVKKNRNEYEQWATEQFNKMVTGKKIFKGFTPSGNRKYIDYNLQNVVKEMTQQLQAGESFFYGAGTVRSKFANEMKTIKQIQAKRDEIVSEEDMKKIKEESADVFSQALDDLKPFYKYDTSSGGYSDDAGNAIIEGRKGLNEAFNMTPEAQQIVDDLLEYLTALPTSYFEAKVQRAVGFEEFNTAVVPRGMRKDALQILKDAGLKIKTYDPKDKASRADVIAKQKQLLFQPTPEKKQPRGYYDPANSIIRLTEAADLSTFLHEFAHFMYEMEVNGDTEMLKSINSWYKRNAEDVAKEAGEYAPNTTIIPSHVVAFLDEGTTGDKERDDAIRRAVHEHFARGFETYLMEGKAPSIELRNAFRAFARWLSRIYQALKGQLNVNLDAEMRQVFDRLLATEEQIQAAEARARVEPLFTDATMAGMTEKEFADYQIRQEKVKDVQSETLRDKIIKQLTRQTEKWWKEEKQDIVDEEIESLSKQQVHLTRERLKTPLTTKAFDVIIEGLDKEILEIDKRVKKLKRENDTIGKFIAKSSGLNRESMESEGVDPAHFKDKVSGKPLFPAKGGMTVDDFAEKLNEQDYKGGGLTSNDALDIIFDTLTADTTYVNADVGAEIDALESDMDSIEQDKVEAEKQSQEANIKLDHATVKEMAGEEKTNKLGRKSVVIPPELRGMTAKGMEGIHPDEAAAFFGYSSGSEMINDLTTAPNIKVQAEVNAEARMIDRHGDILTDGTIEREADEAVASEERGKLILAELKALAKGTNAPTVDRQTIKALAEERIGKLSYRQIHPGKYRKAEIRAAQEAARMLAEGNRDGAAAAKLRQVTNYYLGMAATNAKNETTKIVDRMARYNKKKVRESIMKVEGGYWDQIVKILGRFEFRKAATLKETESLNVWMNERNGEAGDALTLTNAVLNESYVTHWKNVPFSDLQGINDSVKNIEHVARYADKIRMQQEEVDFKKLKSQWIDHIGEQDQRFETKESRSRIADAREATGMDHIRKWASQLTKIPFLASWLDGGERAGLSHDILVQPMTDALDDKIKMIDEVATPVLELISGRSKEDQKRHMRKIFIPEIDDHLLGHQVVAVALNTGNQGNLKKMLLGEGWANPEVDAEISIDNPKLQAVLAHMTKSDWVMVQKIWDQMELLYPKLAEVHRRTTGLTPPKVQSTPVETKHGTFKGGYYPVKYSPRRSHKAEKNAEKREAETESMFNNTASIQSSVNTGATNERTGFYDRIYLSLEVIPDHFNETIHYITHHDAVRQTNRLIQSPDVASAITGVLGEEEFKQLKPWLNDVAKDGRQQPVKTYIDVAFGRLRFGTTLGVMGFKASTGIMQLFGIMTTAAELGVGPTVQGIYTTIGRSWYMNALRRVLGSREDMQTGWDFAAERSKVMNHRAKTMDREIRNAMDRLQGKSGMVAAVQETSMKHIALIQTYMIDLPTWHAAYDKELSESGDESKAINRADWSVENLQGSGATKDMATILRNQSKIHTTFTMFMTFFSSLGNLSRDLVKGARTGIYSPTSVAAKTMFLFTLPVFFEMLMRGELDEPEGEDDRMSDFLTKVALYPITSVPYVRDVASGLLSDFGYNSSPVASLLEKGIQGSKQMIERGFTDEEMTLSAVKNTSKLVAAAAGIPGVNQMWATGEHLYDVIEEGEDLTARQLLFGPERK
mgnify:CR=1 FL=1